MSVGPSSLIVVSRACLLCHGDKCKEATSMTPNSVSKDRPEGDISHNMSSVVRACCVCQCVC